MSHDQLLDAYVDGRMSRRTLIRRLVAAGVSVSAAVSYAHLLRPQPASARTLKDMHEATFSAELIVQDLDRVIRKGFVKVRATSSGPRNWDLYLHLYRSPEKTNFPDAVIGHTVAEFTEAGTKTVKIPITNDPLNHPFARRALKRQRRRARLGVALNGYGDAPAPLDMAVFRR